MSSEVVSEADLPPQSSQEEMQQLEEENNFYQQLSMIEKQITSSKVNERKNAVAMINNLANQLSQPTTTLVSTVEEKETGIKSLVDCYFMSYRIYTDSDSINLLIDSFKNLILKAVATAFDETTQTTLCRYIVSRISNHAKSLPKENKRLRYLPQNTLLSWSLALLSTFFTIFEKNSDITTSLFFTQTQLCQDQSTQQLQNNYKDFVVIFNTLIEHKDTFLNYYCKIVLLATQPMSLDIHQCFIPLFKKLSVEEFTNQILGPISRLIKRSQDQILPIFRLILENCEFDISSLVKSQIIPLVVPVLQSSTIDRNQTKQIFKQIANKTLDSKILSSIVQDDVAKSLVGSGSSTQKINTLSAINSFHETTNLSATEKLNLAKLIVNSITTYLEKELNKSNRLIGFKVLGNWMRYCDQLTDQTIKLITTSLKNDDDGVKSVTIKALANSLGSDADQKQSKKLTQINQFTDTINNIIKSIKNPKTCDTSVTSASLIYLLALATTSAFPNNLSNDKNFIQLVFGSQSFVHQVGFLQRTSKKDHIVDLLISIVKNIKSFSVKASEKSVYSSLMVLVTHTQWKLRIDAINKIRPLHNDYPNLSDLLFTEFTTLLEQESIQQQQQPQQQSSFNFTRVFSAILSKNLSSQHYPALALLSNHPLTGEHTNWKKTVSNLKIKEGHIQILKDHAKEIATYLFNKGLHNKRIPIYQSAFTQAVNELVKYNVPALIENIVQNMVKSLSIAPFTNLTPLQLSIFNTPEGELYQEKSEKVIENKNDRKPKKKTADEIREEEFKKKQEEKRKKESGEAERIEKERQKQLQSQSAIRKDIHDSIKIINIAMDTTYSMTQSNPQFLGIFLSPLINEIFQLMKHYITNEKASDIYEKMYICIPARLKISRTFSRGIVLLLNNIYYQSSTSEIQLLSTLQKVLTHLKELTAKEPLPGSAFCYFWPLVKNGLEKTISFTIQEISMEIIEKHTQQGQPYPRGSMIASLIIVVSTSSRLETIARNTIFQIINGVEISDISELMLGLVSPHHQVRQICLQAIEKIPSIYSPDFVWDEKYIGNLYFVRFDPESSTSLLADKLWNTTNQSSTPPQEYLKVLHDSTFNQYEEVRKINASALKAASLAHPDQIQPTLEFFFSTYQTNYPDEIKDTPTLSLNRRSVAAALAGIGTSIVKPDDISLLFDWIINTGLTEPKDEILQEFVQTGMTIITEQGKKFSNELLKTFEAFLAQPDDGSGDQDATRANVVVFMGALAKHMEATNPKVTVVIDKLVEALSIPSQSVQSSISKCIAQLIPHFKQQGDRLIPILLANLKNGSDYASRRGAAFGLAGAVKGLGISSLKNYDILNVLQGYVEDKKHPNARQGALFAFECLCNTIGRIFEPYVIQILPKLLVCFGDTVSDVREATSETARAIMSQLSGHGVKIVLPALLKALDDRSWRTKEGSIELLGAMAFCAPKQLSACLPTIVPKLTNVLNDTHSKVQSAAKEALSHIGSVIRNPEIQIHVPLVLKTYDDPDIHSSELLEKLLSTNYVHTIDPASLSLIMPILERTLKERSSELKKMTCQIVGNLCSLTEPKDLIPYLPTLMPVMKNVLLDPIPEVRAICARALGLLVRGMGEESFASLIPWLLETVKSDQGAVERSGAAQGLSEVLASLDISRFSSLLGDLMTMANSPRAHVREGIMSIFIFTPISLGQNFLPYLPKILPQVLKGLADDSDPVREVCMRCGQSIIGQFAITGIEVIVPALEGVLFHENWRIRLSGVQLFGDLLFKLVGSTPDDEEKDPNINNERENIYKILGKERFDRILSSLYMMRFDNNSPVRQKVLLIWKYIVSNTPKTLREILPSLIEMIISSIGSSNIEKRQVSAKTLGDIVSKLSDRILPEILPILEKGLTSDNEETRQGVCIGLSEVISSARALLLPFLSSVVSCIGKALCDDCVDVREASAKAFDYLYSTFGSKASNEILPSLIQSLDNPNPTTAANALDGLRQIILLKSNIVLSILIPKLLSKPISSSNVKALASLSKDAGEGLFTHLSTMVPSLIESFTDPNTANAKEIKEAAISICRSVSEDGYPTLIPLLLEQTEVRLPNIRLGACELIGELFTNNNANFEDFIDSMIVSLLLLFNDPDKGVQIAANTALGNITKTIKKDNLSFLSSVQKGIQFISNDQYETIETIPGFCLPKGLASVLPILLNGLLYGTSDQREQATNTLNTVIKLTSQDGLKPFVMQITGPLILVIGDKFPWQVKAAILSTLSLLISKSPASMKIFLHQLQHTFIKALSDTNKTVRNNAASALGLLMTLSTSVDQLVNSLIQGLATADSISQDSKLRALQSIFDKKPKVEQATLEKVIAAIIDFLYQPSDDLRLLVAQVIGTSSKCFATQNDLNQFIKTHLISPSQSVLSRYGKSLALGEIFKHSGEQLISNSSPHISAIVSITQADCKDEKGPIRESSAYLAEAILNADPQTFAKDLIPSLCNLINDQSSTVAITSLQIIKRFCKHNPTLSRQFLSTIVPQTMNRLKDRSNLPLKLATERTLVHSLQIFKESVVMDEFIKTIDNPLAQTLLDYYKRVLIKLSPDSDIENN
eukprot:gene8022-9867_t